jgi:hypothetical protein
MPSSGEIDLAALVTARFVVQNPIANGSFGASEVGARKVVAALRQVVVRRIHFGHENRFRHRNPAADSAYSMDAGQHPTQAFAFPHWYGTGLSK